MEDELILQQVIRLRRHLPRVGGRKLHYLLGDFMRQHGISMGRDQLFDLLQQHGLLIKKKRRGGVRTTNSRHRFRLYPNLVKGVAVLWPEQLWVSDITYIHTEEGFCYLSVVTDAYSKKIMGFYLCDSLAAEGPVKALRMALSARSGSRHALIHHSDRGIQYCSTEYVGLLEQHGVAISMTQNGDPYENAIAERVNGILKDEFGLSQCFADRKQAQKQVRQGIGDYNTLRPHASCDYLTPEQAHQREGALKKRWKAPKKKVPQDAEET